MKKSIIGAALGLGAVLSVSAWMLAHRGTDTLDNVSTVELAPLEINYTGMQIAAADMAEADGALRRLVARRDDAGLSLRHTHKVVRLAMPSVDTDRFDDYEIMRDAYRKDAYRFIELYTHNGGLLK